MVRALLDGTPEGRPGGRDTCPFCLCKGYAVHMYFILYRNTGHVAVNGQMVVGLVAKALPRSYRYSCAISNIILKSSMFFVCKKKGIKKDRRAAMSYSETFPIMLVPFQHKEETGW